VSDIILICRPQLWPKQRPAQRTAPRAVHGSWQRSRQILLLSRVSSAQSNGNSFSKYSISSLLVGDQVADDNYKSGKIGW